ncbi:MAG: hypothetical protein EP338_03415 [Bacteroidetes bacterium]|nr:MAG: hypothetical protein EP338_03415 [Bacteroidota bacterium]
MKTLFSCLTVISWSLLFSQGMIAHRNELAIESGLFNRGLVGFSYTRNFAAGEQHFWSASASTGAGIYWAEGSGFIRIPNANTSQYYCISPAYNLGKENRFLSLGAEGKIMTTRREYSGYGLGFYAGYTSTRLDPLVFKLRMGLSYWSKSHGHDPDAHSPLGIKIPVPMIGVSFGWQLGKRL